MKKNNYFLNFGLILVFTGVVLYFSLKDNFSEVMGAISKMSPLWLLIVLSWGVLYTVVWGLVYFVMGRKYVPDYSVKNGVIVAFVGTFFSGITPSSTGGQFAQAYIMKKQGIKVSDGASLLWADFIIYQTTMMIYVTIMFLLKFSYYSQQSGWFNIILLGYMVNAVVILALYTMALFPNVYIKLSGIAANFLGKVHLVKDPQKTLDSWTLQVKSFTGEIKNLTKDKKTIVICALINVVRLTLLYSLPYVIGRALGIDLAPRLMIDVIALSGFVTMANSFIPVPGASGGTEIVFSLLFSPLMGKLTSAVMILWRFSTYHIVLLIGGIIFAVVKGRYDKEEAAANQMNFFSPD